MSVVSSMKRFVTIKLFAFMKKKNNPIEVLEYQLIQSRKQMGELSTTLSNFRAQQAVAAEKRTELAKKEVQLQLVVDSSIRSNNDDMGALAYTELAKVRQKKEMSDQQIDYLGKVVGKLEEQYQPLRLTIQERESAVDALKVKYEFAQSMGSINKQLKGQLKEFNLDFTSIEDIEKDISIQMHTELDQNNMLTTENTLQRMSGHAMQLSYEAYKEEQQQLLEANQQ